jgi:hypothetical protein
MGRDIWRTRKRRLTWYADEYDKAYGRRPDFAAYWSKDDGLDRLRRDFEFTEPAPFNCFQARFNLLIALLPITPENPAIVTRVLQDLRATGLNYAEVRGVVPAAFNETEARLYLQTITAAAAHCAQESSGSFTPQLAISLPRREDLLWQHYKWVREFKNAFSDLGRFISAVDFSHYEEGFPPRDKAGFFRQIHLDNQTCEQALAVLYHVGESFSGMSIMSAARWIFEAHRLGAHRLGHAIALGLNPENLAGLTVQEPTSERRDHLHWLQEHADLLGDHGHQIDASGIKKELASLDVEASTTILYSNEVIADVLSLQNALLKILALEGAIIESCPTSNFRIGQIKDAAMHPLPRFMQNNLRVVVSTDDPGIFAISLASEEKLCRKRLGLNDADLQRLATASEGAKSHLLIQRP